MVGGGGSAAFHLTQSLRRANNVVHVITPRTGGSAPGSTYPTSTREYFLAQRRLVAASRSIERDSCSQPDVIVTPDLFSAPASRVLARRHGVPNVVVLCQSMRDRCWFYEEAPVETAPGVQATTRELVQLEEYAVRTASHLIALSGWVKQRIGLGYNVNPQHCTTILPGLPEFDDITPFSRIETSPAQLGEFVVVFVGRLVVEKGVRLLPRTVANLRDSGVPIKLIVLGDGPERSFLEQAAIAHGLTRSMQIRGRVDHDEVLPQLRRADAGIIPSLDEPLGFVALEMMSASLPLVASAAGGLAELIRPDIDGLLVRLEREPAAIARNAAALSHALKRLYQDLALRQRLGESGYGRGVLEFSQTRYGSRLTDVLKRLVESPTS